MTHSKEQTVPAKEQAVLSKADIEQWINQQSASFTNWTNAKIRLKKLHIASIINDFHGVALINLLEVLSHKKCPFPYKRKPANIFQKRENIQTGLNFCEYLDVKLVGINVQSLLEPKDLRIPLGLIWTIILKFSIAKAGNDDEVILEWSQDQVKDRDLELTNIGEDFKDGKAYLAIYEKQNPTKFNYQDVSDNPEENFKMAKPLYRNDGVDFHAKPTSTPAALSQQTRVIYERYTADHLHYDRGKSNLLNWAKEKSGNPNLKNFDSDWKSGETFLQLYDGIYGSDEGKNSFNPNDVKGNFEKAKELFNSKKIDFILDPDLAVSGYDDKSITLQVADLYHSTPMCVPVNNEIAVSREVQLEHDFMNEPLSSRLDESGPNSARFDDESAPTSARPDDIDPEFRDENQIKEDQEIEPEPQKEGTTEEKKEEAAEEKNEEPIQNQKKPLNNCCWLWVLLIIVLLLYLFLKKSKKTPQPQQYYYPPPK